MTGQLCLKWNNHATAFTKLLNKIYLEDAYSDATILCQGKFYPVHRFVLSTCSDYFEEMFRQCVRLNNKHPFIIVKDIQHEQMEALLNYMYKGEVNVPQEMLPELIKAAEAFKIKGLAVPDEEPTPKSSRKRSNISSPNSMPKRSKQQEERPSLCNKMISSEVKKSPNSCENESSQSLPSTSSEEIYITDPCMPKIKSEPLEQEDGANEQNPSDSDLPFKDEDIDSYLDNDSNFEPVDYGAMNDNLEDGHDSTSWEDSQTFEGEVEGNEDNPDHNFIGQPIEPTSRVPLASNAFEANQITTVRKTSKKLCPFPPCSYQTISKQHMQYHIRKHTGEKPFKCSQCPYRCAQKSGLNFHIRSRHSKIKPFSCLLCKFKSAHKRSIAYHMTSRHKEHN